MVKFTSLGNQVFQDYFYVKLMIYLSMVV